MAFDQKEAVFANTSVNVSVNMLKMYHRFIIAFTAILMFLKHALVLWYHLSLSVRGEPFENITCG